MTEFQLIDQFFAKHVSKRTDVVLGIGDDCAILQPPADQQLVMTTDTFIEEIHFPKKTDPHAIGYKSLAISLSDIAAMGAEPAWALLSLTLPKADEKWLAEFCRGFYYLIDKYSLALTGGNTAHGPLSITTQVTGFIPPDKAMLRSGAKPGDLIYVTGTLGDAGLGLKVLQGKAKLPDADKKEMLKRYFYPEPRVKEGMTLRQLATSCIDISDGLAGDLNHILESSNVGATIYTHKLPLSKTLRTAIKSEAAWQLALISGDDYELCFTIPAGLQSSFELMFGSYDCGYICIGKIEAEKGLRILDPENKPFKIEKKGYEHF